MASGMGTDDDAHADDHPFLGYSIATQHVAAITKNHAVNIQQDAAVQRRTRGSLIGFRPTPRAMRRQPATRRRPAADPPQTRRMVADT
jgi:hypothetical protein